MFIKKQKIIIYSFIMFLLCGFYIESARASEIEDEWLTTPIIMNKLTSLSYKDAQEFSQNLTKAQEIVSDQLTSGWPVSRQLPHKERSRFLKLMKHKMDGKGFATDTLYQVNETEILFGDMLQFCEDFTRKLGNLSLLAVAYNAAQPETSKDRTMLFLLGRKETDEEDIKHTLKRMRQSLKDSYPLCPASVLEFRKEYKDLLKKTEPWKKGGEENDEEMSHKIIADALLKMKKKQVKEFCEKYDYCCFQVSQTYFGMGPHQYDEGSGHPSLRSSTKKLLKSLKKYNATNVKELKDFELLKIEETPLTLGRYLEFWLTMHPKHDYKDRMPFVSEKRRLHIESVLASLELTAEAQQDKLIRKRVRSLQKVLRNPFYMPPVEIVALEGKYEKLKSAAEGFSYRAPLDLRMKESSVLYGTLGVGSLGAGAVGVAGLSWYFGVF